MKRRTRPSFVEAEVSMAMLRHRPPWAHHGGCNDYKVKKPAARRPSAGSISTASGFSKGNGAADAGTATARRG
ncbi:hypothetical protein NE465_12475, partial [Gordonibacter pamelaeae]|uniref:hypothetical protein n=1 Tax=Gordonibacter pamelaeae TaxID=471189 RepID=UPI00210AFE40